MFKIFRKSLFLLLIVTAWSFIFSCFLTASQEISSVTPSQEKNKLCLSMIVKNESRIIERCLDSVKDVIDCISICDTGSTDNTVEIIEQYLKKHQILGKVHHHTWKNFGHNRSLSIQAAQQTLQELHFPLSHTYLLLLDADMLLQIEPTFRKDSLEIDSYLVMQKNPAISYYNTRLVRASLPWECVGVTHEYWACKQNNQVGQLHTLIIDDKNDGGCKADKFERDIRLLTQGLKDEPDNVRYLFYLAQSYLCIQNYPEAIKWYKARIEKGGWIEEVWFAKLSIAECYEKLGFWDHALHWYLDAYQHNPARAESLHKIATYYRLQGQNDLAYLFAKQGSRIPYPKDQVLFISDPVYNYQFDEEISVAAYYSQAFKEEGFAAANRLALKKEIPSYIKDQTYKNLRFYAQNLKNAHFQPLDIKLPLLQEASSERYYFVNPSFQKTETGYALTYQMTIPSPNKNIDESLDPLNKKIATRHFLVNYDADFKVLSQKEIFEDLPKKESKTPLRYEPTYDLSRLEASTTPIEFGEGYLMLVHEKVVDDQHYDLHRFVYLDQNLKIKQLSKPFVFMHKGIESCGSLTIDHLTKKCMIPLVVGDHQAYVTFVELETIRSLLEPLP